MSGNKKGYPIVLGLEKLLQEHNSGIVGGRIGLVCNQASVNHNLQHAADLFKESKKYNLTTLFGPQHGIRGDVQDNMVETAHALDAATGLPIYSLYSETREPTPEMLANLDAIVFDLQDVGCRIYTFIYTLANCMRAAAKYGKKVIVCDRPNPISGLKVAGNLLEPEYASFVGQFPLPTRHGMTVGELSLMFNDRYQINCDLEVYKMEGWGRELWFDDTDLPWVMPSPNMPTLETATVFPGTVHLEGTEISEGRGTTRPFELIGAPYIEARTLARRLGEFEFPGVYFRPCNFQPTFQKFGGQPCGGVQLHVIDRQKFEPVLVGIGIVKAAYDLYGEFFKWKETPYEYVFDRNPFDIIAGTDKIRLMIEQGKSLTEIDQKLINTETDFAETRNQYLLY